MKLLINEVHDYIDLLAMLDKYTNYNHYLCLVVLLRSIGHN